MALFVHELKDVYSAEQQLIFASLDVNPRGTTCVGMTGILQQGGRILEQDLPSSVRDAALIAAGQGGSIMRWPHMARCEPTQNNSVFMTRLTCWT
jgi:ferritin-like metal-binding protein YciE